MPCKTLAIIRSSYRPDGGAERIIMRMLEGLKKQVSLNVSLITKHWDQLESADFKVLICPQRGWFRHTKFRNFNEDVMGLLKHHHFDLLQSHERIPGCQIYRAGDGVHKQWLEIRKQNASVVQAFIWDHSPYHKAILNAEKKLFQHPDLKKVICNSPQIKQDILKHYPDTPQDKLEVIYNGINVQAFPYIDAKMQLQARQRLVLGEHDKILLYVGSGFQRKGLHTALHALRLTSEWKLVVVGKDKKMRHYQRLCRQLGIKDRVTFAGVQNDVRDYYAASDLLLHPALYDPAPNVVLEAMATGRGVIVSENCGNHELIETGVNGYICEAGNAKSLATLLENCKDSSQLILLGKAARKTAEKFPVSRMVNALIALYQTCLIESG